MEIASRTSSGFEIVIIGFSNIHAVTQANFSFTGKTGTSLATAVVQVNVETEFNSWYKTTASASYGSQFRLLAPFTIDGDMSALVSVSVTLTSTQGTSSETSATF